VACAMAAVPAMVAVAGTFGTSAASQAVSHSFAVAAGQAVKMPDKERQALLEAIERLEAAEQPTHALVAAAEYALDAAAAYGLTRQQAEWRPMLEAAKRLLAEDEEQAEEEERLQRRQHRQQSQQSQPPAQPPAQPPPPPPRQQLLQQRQQQPPPLGQGSQERVLRLTRRDLAELPQEMQRQLTPVSAGGRTREHAAGILEALATFVGETLDAENPTPNFIWASAQSPVCRHETLFLPVPGCT